MTFLGVRDLEVKFEGCGSRECHEGHEGHGSRGGRGGRGSRWQRRIGAGTPVGESGSCVARRRGAKQRRRGWRHWCGGRAGTQSS